MQLPVFIQKGWSFLSMYGIETLSSFVTIPFDFLPLPSRSALKFGGLLVNLNSALTSALLNCESN
jgi:hypothetical protein